MAANPAKVRVTTVAENGEWKNKVEGDSRTFSTHAAKQEATARGREAARERKVEHFIRTMDGKIAERNTYGHDPRNIPG
ncbi:DUF2188 domain-containing protein [Saccharothrix sp. AJ9571]|nr:DUF2188 domain-containing protein [Saccharothrix sp. AJ9571]